MSSKLSDNLTTRLARLYRKDGQPRSVGVIGHPVEHSLSPNMHNAAFEYYKLPHRYEKWDVADSEVARFLTDAKNNDFLGLNVTVPHKQAVLASLYQWDATVAAIKAANTLIIEEDKLVGYNTDPIGFLEALQREASFDPQDKYTLVLGAGGAARAIVWAVASKGAAEIMVANRTLERANALVSEIAPLFPNVAIFATSLDSVAKPGNNVFRDLVVNTTSLGLLEPQAAFPIAPEILSGGNRETVFFDLTYGDTPFLRTARSFTNHTMDGLTMLMLQGARSFELWTGLVAPREIMLEAARNALLARTRH